MVTPLMSRTKPFDGDFDLRGWDQCEASTLQSSPPDDLARALIGSTATRLHLYAPQPTQVEGMMRVDGVRYNYRGTVDRGSSSRSAGELRKGGVLTIRFDLSLKKNRLTARLYRSDDRNGAIGDFWFYLNEDTFPRRPPVGAPTTPGPAPAAAPPAPSVRSDEKVAWSNRLKNRRLQWARNEYDQSVYFEREKVVDLAEERFHLTQTTSSSVTYAGLTLPPAPTITTATGTWEVLVGRRPMLVLSHDDGERTIFYLSLVGADVLLDTKP